MKIKTKDLTGAALDWAVAKCEGIPAEELYIQKWGSRLPPSIYRRNRDEDGNLDGSYTTGPDLQFSRKWEAGGPIIGRERISIRQWTNVPLVHAYMPQDDAPWLSDGTSPLIAAMRCYCSFKLGDEVDVPEELM